MTDDELKELIEYIAKSLVGRPEDVSVNEAKGETTTLIEVSVAQEDLGKVIGKHGRTAGAMRTLLEAAGSKMGKRCFLEILEESSGESRTIPIKRDWKFH